MPDQKGENIFAHSAKEAARERFIKTPLNLVVFFSAAGVLKWLCAVLGPKAYGSASGNGKLAGALLLTAVTSALGVNAASWILRIKDSKKQVDELWLAGILIPVCFAGVFWMLGRALLIAVGFVHVGSAPPTYLAWLFDSLETLQKLGD